MFYANLRMFYDATCHATHDGTFNYALFTSV
jgi:hypothetical protein